jgi:tRNA(fMet)-specific endonuclease VapC
MTLWILDTDHVSLWQRSQPQVSRRIESKEPVTIATTIITAEEQCRGRLKLTHRADSGIKRIEAYARLRETLFFFRHFSQVLEFSAEAEVQYADLKRQRISIGAQDLKIASIALAVGGIVVTRNRRDFEKVPGLSIEDWSL